MVRPGGAGTTCMSGNRSFVDTNILVYAHDETAGEKHHRARFLLAELWESGDGCLSVQVLQEFFVTVTRKVPKPLDALSAAAIIGCATLFSEDLNAEQRYDGVRVHNPLRA